MLFIKINLYFNLFSQKKESKFLSGKFYFFKIQNFNCKKKKITITYLKKKTLIEKRNIKNGINLRDIYLKEFINNQMITIISIIGICETVYLSFSKIKNSSIICNIGTCSNVLNSSFSEFFEIPISFFGFLFYFFIFLFIKNQQNFKDISFSNNNLQQLKTFDYFLLFFGIIGIYFTLILENILKLQCQWCILSILFTSSILINSIIKQNYFFARPKFSMVIFMIIFAFNFYILNFLEIYFLYK
jgi:uncharacterized membrane protein